MRGGLSVEKKRSSLFVRILLFFVLFPFAFHRSVQATPLAVLTESTFKFGSAVEGTEIEHDFVLKNNGTEPLIIEKIIPG